MGKGGSSHKKDSAPGKGFNGADIPAESQQNSEGLSQCPTCPKRANGGEAGDVPPNRACDELILAEASKVFNSSLDIKETFDRIAKLVSEELGEKCVIFRLRGDRLLALTIFQKGEENKDLLKMLNDDPPPLQGSVPGYCIQKKEPLFIPDTAQDHGFAECYKQPGNIRSCICVPLMAKGSVLGVLCTSMTKAARPFSKNDFDLVIALSDRAAVALENSLLYEKARAQAQRLSVVNEISRAINSTLNIESIYETIVEQLKRLLSFPFATNIAVYHPEDDSFVFSHIYDSSGVLQKFMKVHQHYPSDSLALGEAFKSKKTLYIPDGRVVPHGEKLRKELLDEGIVAFLNLPLIIEEKCIGTLNIGAFHDNPFTEDEIALLETLSRHLAIAMNNARIYEDLRKEVNERKRAEDVVKQTLEKLRNSLRRIIDVIALTVESKDPYTAGHQRRATDLARAIATEMELPPQRIDGIRMAGVIHDLGKLIVPSEILSKPGKLSEQEFNLIKMHPKVGYDILKDIEFPWPVAQIVLQHHEKLNGSGYPSGLTGEDILLEAKILAVSDVVEAMASHRPYRPSLGMPTALDEISKNRGVLYDPTVVDACLKCVTQGNFSFREVE